MCATCGCDSHESRLVSVKLRRNLLEGNARLAGHNRAHFDRLGLLAVNLMSAPGAGKTALLEASIDALGSGLKVAVLVGDLETDNDARRVRAKGVPALQITTGGACHLDADMVHRALHCLPLSGIDVLFIENVGNLVCPASFDLGQHCNVVLLSVTEGDDKPAKYPVMFRAADVMLITKTDLLPYLDGFDEDRAHASMVDIGNPAPVISLSSRTTAGLEAWIQWLKRQRLLHGSTQASGLAAREQVSWDCANRTG